MSVYSYSKIPVVEVEVDFDDVSGLVECTAGEEENMTAVVFHRVEVVELQVPILWCFVKLYASTREALQLDPNFDRKYLVEDLVWEDISPLL